MTMSYLPTDDEKRNSLASRLAFSLGKFDQAVGITENGLNASLAMNWKSQDVDFELKAKDDDGVEYVDCTLKGHLKAPTVEIGSHATDGIFYLHFGLCNIKFDWYDGHKIVHVAEDFSNWTLAWSIDFSWEKINSLPDKHRTYVQGSLRDYSPHRLFVDFSNSNLLVGLPDKCSFPGINNITSEGRRTAIQDKVQSFAQRWITQEREAGNDVLGYQLAALDASKYPEPTLIPTKATIQSYPYYKNGVKRDGEYVREDSAFCFLNMYGTHDLPHNNANAVDTLSYTGNLITPFDIVGAADSAKMAASTCIQGAALWESLKPKLVNMCRVMFYSANSVSAHADTNMDHCSINFSVGMGSSNNATINGPTASSTGSGRDYIISTTSSQTSYNRAGPSGIAGAMEGWLDATGTATLTYQPGSNVLKVVGSSSFTFKYHQRLAATWWGMNTFKAGWTWTFDLTFSPNAQGELTLAVTNLKTTNDDIVNDTSFGYTSNWSENDQKKWFQSTHVTANVDSINSALKANNKFFLPAAGQYWMQSPSFNNEGDLMVGMTLQPW